MTTLTATAAFWQGANRFYIRGIDYQPGGSSAGLDPLADSKVCLRDIAKFKQLGVNTIRVYMVDNSKKHDECMGALADAGIYVVIDANNPGYSLHRFVPGPSYNAQYLQSVFATIDEFARYDNTLAFFSGNEVINDNVTSTVSAKYVKAVTRDMRQYLSMRKLRKVPVGYSAADVAVNRMEQAQYFNCGADDERSDFFAFVRFGLPPLGTRLTVVRTTIPGATPISRLRSGIKRSKTLPVTASLSCKCFMASWCSLLTILASPSMAAQLMAVILERSRLS